MRQFKPKPGTKSAVRIVKTPFPDIASFDSVIRSLILTNPLGCTSYMSAKRTHPPVEKVREMYTAKFTYLNANGKQIGYGLDRYNSVEGYEAGIAAVISNMANREAHKGKIRHTKESDLFSVLVKCHDSDGELYFLSIARDRMTVASYTDDAIRKRVERWVDDVPELQ
jgi:hypothetical protein